MLVDDDEISTFVASRIIQTAHFAKQVISCSSAQEALRYLQTASHPAVPVPDLILLDINMPVMNGWDFLEAYQPMVANLDRKPVVVMLSSSVYYEDIDRARQFPEISEYMAKPLTAASLTQLQDKFF